MRARRGEVVRDAVVCTRGADGRLSVLRCNAAPLMAPDATVVGALVLVQDVTAETAAKREQENLRDRLIGTINHEFRTPLTALLGYAELLLGLGESLPSQARNDIDSIVAAAHELTTLLDTVSQLVDLESHTRLEKSTDDVTGLIHDIAADFADSFAFSVTRTTQVPQQLCATIDSAELRRAIWELLKNAATYAPADSTVELQADGDEMTVWFSVLDNGCGISPEERDRLVHAFERGTHAGQPASSKGLGLAIARTVATAHGGRLELSDRKPHGLCATLVVPRFDA